MYVLFASFQIIQLNSLFFLFIFKYLNVFWLVCASIENQIKPLTIEKGHQFLNWNFVFSKVQCLFFSLLCSSNFCVSIEYSWRTGISFQNDVDNFGRGTKKNWVMIDVLIYISLLHWHWFYIFLRMSQKLNVRK